jgi:hypothetical protein
MAMLSRGCYCCTTLDGLKFLNLKGCASLWTSQRRHQSGLDAHNYATEKTVVRYVPTALPPDSVVPAIVHVLV